MVKKQKRRSKHQTKNRISQCPHIASHLAHGVGDAKRGCKEKVGEADGHNLLECVAEVRPGNGGHGV